MNGYFLKAQASKNKEEHLLKEHIANVPSMKYVQAREESRKTKEQILRRL